MSKALTVKAIEALKPGSKRFEVLDGGCPGLCLVVQPTDVRSWTFRYRSPTEGRTRNYTIGRLTSYSLAEARAEAAELRRLIGRGVDPAEQKRVAKAKANDTSHDIDKLLDTFLERHVDALKQTTARLMRQQIETELRPAWGRRKIETITRADVATVVDALVRRGAPIGANRLFSSIRLFLRWCVGRGVITASPVEGMRRPANETSRDRVLTDDELTAIWEAAADVGPFGAVVRLLMLTGQRRMEVGAMRWSELRLEGALSVWVIPPARTKNGREHSVPIVKTAAAIIEALPKIAGSDIVFTTDGETVSSGWSKNKTRIDRLIEQKGRAVAPWTLHDLRRTCASGLARLRQPPHVIEALLNHKTGTVSGIAAVYNRYEYADEKRAAAEAWEGLLLSLCEGRGGNVVAFAR